MLRAHVDMEIIIDAYREFMKDPFRQSKDFIDFIRKGCDIIIYGRPREIELNIVSQFLEGRGESQICSVHQRYEEARIKLDVKIPYQVFFIHITDPEKKTRERCRNPFFCAFLDDYKEAFKRLSDSSYLRVNDANTKSEFKKWDDILPDLPITEIIMTDPYIFKLDPEYKPFEENFFKLLKKLNEKYNLKSLLIFNHDIDAKKRSFIVKKSKEILGEKTFFWLIVTKRKIEHDRYMFMNYSFLSAGSSFNYFNTEGMISVKSSSKMEFFPFTSPRNFKIALDVLQKLYEDFRVLQEEGAIPAYVDSGLFYFLKNPANPIN